VDFYVCWIGDERKPSKARATITVHYFDRRPFEFDDGALLKIVAA
jgi:hypothetical protein